MNTMIDTMYGIVDGNLENAGEPPLTFTKEMMKSEMASDFGVLDLYVCKDVDNYNFLILSYLKLLNRLPEDSMLEIAKNERDIDPEQYRKDRIRIITNSEEFSHKNNHIIHSTFNTKDGRDMTSKVVVNSFKRRTIDFMYKIYTKLPKPIKNGCKKIINFFRGGK